MLLSITKKEIKINESEFNEIYSNIYQLLVTEYIINKNTDSFSIGSKLLNLENNYNINHNDFMIIFKEVLQKFKKEYNL